MFGLHKVDASTKVNSSQSVNNKKSANSYPQIIFLGSNGKTSVTNFNKFLWDSYIDGLVDKSLKSLGIKEYNFSVLKDDNTAIMQSQKHLINLLKYYEGDKYHYYEAITVPYSDKFGTSTCGFGERTKEMRNQETAYENLVKHIEEHAKYVKNILGTETYNSLPSSIKEGLIDLSYNKGPKAISGNPELKQAIKNKQYDKVIENLVYVTSGKSGASEKSDPGLYRRSLSRAILASRDLGNNRNVQRVIDEIYSDAKNCPGQSIKDLDKIYSAYKNGKIDSKAISCESGKYEVKKGDTLYSIARQYCPEGVSVNSLVKEIVRINHNVETLKPGFTINIPLSIDGEPLKLGQNEVSHVQSVKENQSRQSVAKVKGNCTISDETEDFHVGEEYKGKGYFAVARDIHSKYITPDFSISDLSKKISALNNGKPLEVGDTIKIPVIKNGEELSQMRTSGSNNTKSEESQASEPDDLGISAPNQSTSLKSMMSEMKYNVSKAGNTGLNILTFDYVVRQGDTLYSIAQRYGIDAKTLMANNNLSSKSTIKVGQKIKINKVAYSIKRGDVLNKISDKYGLSTSFVQSLNGIENVDKIKVGDYIEIPGYIYSVKRGDNVTKIANNAGISLQTLKSVNGLKSSAIQPNQKLLILYNDADYNVDDSNREVKINESGKKIETIKMEKQGIYANRPHLTKTKVNGKVVATREVFYDPNIKKGPLKGKTIIVNAGHGFHPDNIIDCGVKGQQGLDDEWLINYDNAMRLIQRLKKQGAKVIYIQGYEGKASKGQDLVSKAIRGKNNKADLFISIHVNSSKSANQEDRMDIFYPSGSADSKILAAKFEKEMDAYAKNKDYANSKKSGYQVLNTAKSRKTPSILWEVAFMNSVDGRKKLKNPRLMDKYSDILCQSVVEYFGEKGKKSYYTVKRGDSLGKIAEKYGVTIAELKATNDISGTNIDVGQLLEIPSKSS